MKAIIVVVGLLSIIVSFSGLVSCQRPPKGEDTRLYCKKLLKLPTNTTLKYPMQPHLNTTDYDCYYYARCVGTKLEYDSVNVIKEDLVERLLASKWPADLIGYHQCLKYASMFCQRGRCPSRFKAIGTKKCIKKNPVLPAENWPCFLDGDLPPKSNQTKITVQRYDNDEYDDDDECYD